MPAQQAPWPEITGRPITVSVDNYARARLCVNACAGVSDEWLEAYANPETAALFGPGMPIDKALQYCISRAIKEELARVTMELQDMQASAAAVADNGIVDAN